jgi:hypothetical protein
MHEHERNTPKASTAFAGAGPHACLIGQKSRLSRWLPRLLLAIGVVGPATLLLRCTPADAQEHHNSLQQEIAQVEQQVDNIESEALATIPSLVPGSPERLPRLGTILFFDKELSVNHNEACAFCHMPQTGFQGAIESLNEGTVAQPGSVRTRFSLRKPPSAAYAAFSPPLFYPDKPGEAKCSHCFYADLFCHARQAGHKGVHGHVPAGRAARPEPARGAGPRSRYAEPPDDRDRCAVLAARPSQ